jgi:hypothetical protein
MKSSSSSSFAFVKFLVPCFKAVAVSEASPDLSLSLMAPAGMRADTLMTGTSCCSGER